MRYLAWYIIRTALSLYVAVESGVVGGQVFSQNLIAVATTG